MYYFGISRITSSRNFTGFVMSGYNQIHCLATVFRRISPLCGNFVGLKVENGLTCRLGSAVAVN
jgi:hypothetical protein